MQIGEWIDDLLGKHGDKIVHHGPSDANMELLDIQSLEHEVFIPSSDEKGIVSWHNVKNVTRHDPSQTLYRIKTKWGRDVTVVESQSLLVWNQEHCVFEPRNSTEVDIGDKLGVTFDLPAFTKIDHVNMRDYLYAEKYIYGSDYYTNTQSTYKKWNVQDQRVYTKCSKENSSSLPDKFMLNRENGFFIGLYLAEGNTCKDYVGIANNDETIRSLVAKWFDSYGITSKVQQKKFNESRPGTSISIRGYSTILVQFLESFVGKYSYGKYVPEESYIAPDEFVKGLIDGYISGDGCITGYHVVVSSVSKKLITGIQQLLLRFGIFTKMSRTQQKSNNVGSQVILPRFNLSVQSKYVYKFAKEFTLSHPGKQEQLQNLVSRTSLGSMSYLYEEQNNVVLDKIVSIEKIPSMGTKVYDITVPSTLNFQLFNGLNVRDTSEIGYLQRKLVKAMEDCKIGYDYTVRNASGSIVQFLYGEDGMDASKIESQPLHFIEMDLAHMRKEYLLTEDDPLENVLTEDSFYENQSEGDNVFARCKEHYEQVLKDREYMIQHIFNKQKETSIMYPVSFMRIINITKSMYKHERGLPLDITPMYILDAIDSLCKELYISRNNPGNLFMNILLRSYLSPKMVLYDYKFSRMAFDHVTQQIRLKFYDAIAHPSEMVGVIAAQSIGEPCTQLTLNSVDWNTEILVDFSGKLMRFKIGQWIDQVVDDASTQNIEHHPNDTKLVWLKDCTAKILSCDENGQVSWKLIEAVTKHPPINADGSNVLLKVKTKSGREVIATKAKSFLKRVDNKIQEVQGDELKVGDYLPVSTILPIPSTNDTWDVSLYLPKTEFVYMTEVSKALVVYNDALQQGCRQWFTSNQGKIFTLPYTRSDSFIDAFVGVGKNHGHNIIHSRDSCVYPKNMIYQPAHMPEKIVLDSLSGFFFGAYLAEGTTTRHHVLISNIDSDFNNNIIAFADQYNINYHIDERKDQRGHSKTIRMHSIVLAQLITRSFGTGAQNKRMPSELLQANDEFTKALIDGYMSGDGCVDKKLRALSVTSISKGLLEDIQQVLTRFGVQGTIAPCDANYENSKAKGVNAHLAYKLQLNAHNSYVFKNSFSLVLKHKQARLDTRNEANNRDNIDVIPDISTKEFGVFSIAKSKIPTMIDKCTYEEDKQVLRKVLEENIMYDQVVSIEEVISDHPYVYDLTVQDTRNFNIYNGLAMRDTFHLSGVSSASKAVRGVPRIKELLSVTKNIKSPAMNIFLTPNINKDKMKSKEVLNTIETTYFKDIVTSTKIYYDPDDFNTTVDEDRFFIQSYAEFMDLEKIKAQNLSPWVLRMEFIKEKMLEYQISMIDIYHVLNDFYEDNISAIFSDDNAEKLVFRIKIHEEAEPGKEEDRDIITELKALEKNILETINIKGIRKVNKVSMNKKEYFQYNQDTMLFDKTYEWVLESSGSNLVDIMCLPHVDNRRTVSNNINDIYELFGIEAARQALYNEISEVIKDADLYVNYRHIALLVDTMTNKGYIISIDRHGINRGDIGPLAKSSFEETTDMLIKAGIFSEVDRINGVSANIMLGQIPPCGTGDTDILIDELKLAEQIAEENTTNTEEDNDPTCDVDVLTFDFTLPPVDSSITKKAPVVKIVKT